MKDEDINKGIGKRLREAREKAGLSQAQLAQELGYESATAVSLIEAGERKFKAEDFQRAAEVLHQTVGYFLGQENRIPDIKVALRADKDLTDADKKAVLHFIELAKKRHEKRGGTIQG
ncbi:MAG: helix-turn-helix transcriptional regulator [Patescibacteria group bacterium]|nr:helix-turn-helix transcriptional regulator [Patescibacteria group bacterium]MDE2438125.1 helix-turn-helix transcriptional regulator [Patescibacteria group bacterium]